MMRKTLLILAAAIAVIALSAGTTVGTAYVFPGLLPQGKQGARGPTGPAGRAGVDGVDGVDGKEATVSSDEYSGDESASSASEPHLHLMGRDLGTLAQARAFCDSVRLDIEQGGPYPSNGGSIIYPHGNENRANCGYSNGDLDKFLEDRKTRGDYYDLVY